MLDDLCANPNEIARNGESAIQRAIFNNDHLILKELIDKGVDLDRRHPKTNFSPAIEAILRGKPKLLNLILESGASLDYTINNKKIAEDFISKDAAISAIQ